MEEMTPAEKAGLVIGERYVFYKSDRKAPALINTGTN